MTGRISLDNIDNVQFNISEMCDYIKEWRIRKGFYTPSQFLEADQILVKLMLVVTELSEGAEAVRLQNYDNFVEEMADTFIRLMDLSGSMGLDIESAIIEKMKINEGRAHKHGKVV